MKGKFLVAAAALVIFAAQAKADTAIPYPNIETGTVAPTNVFTATATGDVWGYFVSRGSAGDLDYVRGVDVTAGTCSDWIFDNQTSSLGDSVDLGHVNAGDVLEIELKNASFTTAAFPDGIILSSNPLDSFDTVNHAYSTPYTDGSLGSDIPAGIYFGMEDLPYFTDNPDDSDLNYNDDTLVFTNVTATPAVPEPGSFLLLGSGLLGLAGLVRRKLSA